MVIDCDLIAEFDFMTDFNGINRHYPNPFYPAGIYDEDNMEHKMALPSSEYPNLTLPEDLHDKYGYTIPAGFYTVAISDDLSALNLYQSNELKARVKILKLVEEMHTNEELEEENKLVGEIEKAKSKNNLKKMRKAEEDYKAFKDKETAKTYAKIEDTGKGYYILTYNCFGKKATGIIQK